MKPNRNVGHVSALHLPRICEGLKETTSSCKLSPEETRRFKAFVVACKPLMAETHLRLGAEIVEASVGAIDARVDRGWYVLRDLLEAYERLAEVSALGAEAGRLKRKYLPNVDFTRLDTSAQLTHGKTLLACLAEEDLSKELLACLRPVLTILEADHVEYEQAIQADLVRVARASQLVATRKAAVEALQGFVTLVEVLASAPEEIAQVELVLAPVDAILEKVKREKPKGAGDAVVAPPESVGPLESVGMNGV